VLKALNYAGSRSKWWDIVVQLLMALLFRAAFFFMLKLREALSK
jgi:hypothetical protein